MSAAMPRIEEATEVIHQGALTLARNRSRGVLPQRGTGVEGPLPRASEASRGVHGTKHTSYRSKA